MILGLKIEITISAFACGSTSSLLTVFAAKSR